MANNKSHLKELLVFFTNYFSIRKHFHINVFRMCKSKCDKSSVLGINPILVGPLGSGGLTGLWWAHWAMVGPLGYGFRDQSHFGGPTGLWWAHWALVGPLGYGGLTGLWWAHWAMVISPIYLKPQIKISVHPT